MAMVFVMNMTVSMLQRLMRMRVFMPFGQMQPDPDAHQYGRRPERGRRGVAAVEIFRR